MSLPANIQLPPGECPTYTLYNSIYQAILAISLPPANPLPSGSNYQALQLSGTNTAKFDSLFYDSAGVISVDYFNRVLKDTFNLQSIGFAVRRLYDSSTGTNVQVQWLNDVSINPLSGIIEMFGIGVLTAPKLTMSAGNSLKLSNNHVAAKFVTSSDQTTGAGATVALGKYINVDFGDGLIKQVMISDAS